MARTHKCADLRIEDDKREVTLIGWAQRIRDHGGKKFIDLRDREGITQAVFDPDVTKDFVEVESFRREYLIEVNGIVRPRPEGTVNEKHATGKIEVLVKDFKIVNKCDVLPFDLDEEHYKEVSEDLRLEYRYLDLRRKEMYDVFARRHKFIMALRKFFDKNDFIEVETPFLAKSTPEGARDMLVPARKQKGNFYALPQSPQLFKQLLMVAGFERYFQVVKCFRDEDSRKDRQLEFTQLDLEMSLIEWEEFRVIMQESLIEAFKVYGHELKHGDFAMMSHDEAVSRYGSDKPDMRIKGLELKDISDIAKDCGFSVFKGTIERKGIVKGILVEDSQDKITRKEVDRLIAFAQEHGAKGMAWMKVTPEGLESSITKFFKTEELDEIKKRFAANVGDYIFFIADEKGTANDVLDALRRHLAVELERVGKDNKFVWITEFPLFGYNEEEKRIDAEHSPFTMPNEEAVKFIEENIHTREDVKKYHDELLKLKSDCYDLAFNGIEICSGALRIYRPELQKKVFEIIELSDEQIDMMFGWFLKAYNYGAPYHRGLAFGLDRIIMLLEEKSSIREVMAFPKNKLGYCPLTHAPSPVNEAQLKELSLLVDIKKKK